MLFTWSHLSREICSMLGIKLKCSNVHWLKYCNVFQNRVGYSPFQSLQGSVFLSNYNYRKRKRFKLETFLEKKIKTSISIELYSFEKGWQTKCSISRCLSPFVIRFYDFLDVELYRDAKMILFGAKYTNLL